VALLAMFAGSLPRCCRALWWAEELAEWLGLFASVALFRYVHCNLSGMVGVGAFWSKTTLPQTDAITHKFGFWFYPVRSLAVRIPVLN